MNLVKKDEVFQLKDLIAIEGGKILTEQLVDNDAIKMVLKSFDAGMQLPEHTAQGTALVFCLEGEGVITNAGVEYPLHSGDNFVFVSGVLHSVRAVTGLKIAVILVKER